MMLMNRYITIILCAVLILSTGVAGCWAVDLAIPVKKVIDTSWLKDAGLKYSFLATLCTTQFLSGAVEGYHFNGNTGYLVTDNNYHTYDTLKRIGYIGTGWTMYANIRSKDIRWMTKARRIVGGILISRLAFETAYRWERYNNPFENTPEKNQHAIVYFKFTNGGIQDAYIGTNEITTPLADIGILLLGILIFK